MGNSKSFPDKINVGEEDEMTIIGYKKSLTKTIFLFVAVLLSGGLLLLLLTWKPSFHLKFTHIQCPLRNADKVLLKGMHAEEHAETIIRPQNSKSFPFQHSYFCNKKIKYIWKDDELQFKRVGGLSSLNENDLNVDSCASFYEMSEGLSEVDALYRLQLFGENSILIEVKPIYKLILNELKGPFYIYQMFIVIVWMIQLYYQFAVCIVLLSVISVSATVWETRKQSKALRDAVQSQSVITVLRDGIESQKSSHELVPGDVIIFPLSSFTMECDAVLLSGSCVVNESMLTGESIPIMKVPISSDSAEKYSSTAHKKNTLFCGTQILHSQTCHEKNVKAVVYRTGYTTAKGELVRAILFPKPVDFKLYSDLFKSMLIFLFLGIPAVVYTAAVWTTLQAYIKDVAIIVLDVLTFLIPPVLPAVMTSINAHAQRRLRKQSIFCLNSRYINFCGGLNIICFDKTGTLTEDGLELSGVVPVEDGNFQPAVKNFSHLSFSQLVIAMATCHSLTLVDDELLGYTLDIKMFNAIEWKLEHSNSDRPEKFERTPPRIVYPKASNDKESPVIAIVRQFPFESLLQRMSVVTKQYGNNHFDVYIKGAPEMVAQFSIQHTVPENFKEILESYTRQGFRVLAVGWKSLPSSLNWDEVMKISREDLECEFHFQGLLVLQNPLKPESHPAIMTLRNANIRCIMITGDNLLTATTVARECGMIDELDSVISVEAEKALTCDNLKISYTYTKFPGFSEKLNVGQNGLIDELYMPLLNEGKYHLAMDGTTFSLIRENSEDLLQKVVQKGTVFARMLPEQKLQLIETLQKIDHQVGMCGDGANDCGALKTAHAGVSLSVAEASVASPFTSKIQNIKCIPILVREGRCTLTSTFGACRYMICYCFTLLAAVLMMFWDGQKPSDGAYVMIDIVMNLLPPILFGTTEPYHGIVKRPPSRTILSFVPQFSMLSFIIIQIGMHIFAYYYCIAQPCSDCVLQMALGLGTCHFIHFGNMVCRYEPFVYNNTLTHYPEPAYLGTTIINVNMMSYVIAAVIFASGPPYRKPFFTNKIYLAVLLFEFLLASYLIIYPDRFMMRYMNFKRAPYFDYHLILYVIGLGNFVICYIWETYFVQGFLFEYVGPAIKEMKGPIHLYEKIDKQLSQNNSWPPVGKYEIIGTSQNSNDSQNCDEVDVGVIRRSSRSFQERWACRTSSIRNSLVTGLRLSSEDHKNERSEPLTFATFQDGSYKHVVQSDNSQTFPAQDSFV